MAVTGKPQRIRDPLHNLIEFGTSQFERTLWKVIQTRPFQRLRRVRQLGFSDLVFPGATHSRFAHSIGVFHTARRLMTIITNSLGNDGDDHQCRVALAAALVHDIGHGMFSHAFEEIGKKLQLPMARHEHVSSLIIRETEVSEAFAALGRSFAEEVAEVTCRDPASIYDAVVSSQFDADRLDYMRRDRLMTGVQNSAIDFDWLMANLEVGSIESRVDDQKLPAVDTLVLGPKAVHAAETYVLALFQLYPTVYLHKTTRVAEKLFSSLMMRLIELVKDGGAGVSKVIGLPDNHPITRFAKEPDQLGCVLNLDDTVFWGALPMLAEAGDHLIRDCAVRLHERRLPKCYDVRENLLARIAPVRPQTPAEHAQLKKRLDRASQSILERLVELGKVDGIRLPRLLVDKDERSPYKRKNSTVLKQILIRSAAGKIHDVAEFSPVVAGMQTFELFRVYYDSADSQIRRLIDTSVDEEVGRIGDD